jgi:hypothetical protein
MKAPREHRSTKVFSTSTLLARRAALVFIVSLANAQD